MKEQLKLFYRPLKAQKHRALSPVWRAALRTPSVRCRVSLKAGGGDWVRRFCDRSPVPCSSTAGSQSSLQASVCLKELHSFYFCVHVGVSTLNRYDESQIRSYHWRNSVTSNSVNERVHASFRDSGDALNTYYCAWDVTCSCMESLYKCVNMQNR